MGTLHRPIVKDFPSREDGQRRLSLPQPASALGSLVPGVLLLLPGRHGAKPDRFASALDLMKRPPILALSFAVGLGRATTTS